MAVLPLAAVQLIYIVATVLGVGLAGLLLWRHRDKTGAVALAVATLAGSIWAGSLLGYTVSGETMSLVFLRTLYVGVVLSVPALFVFALEYTGRERYVRPHLLGILSIHPILTMIAVVVNPDNLFFTDVTTAATVFAENPQSVWGPLFYVHTAYLDVLLLAIAAMMVELLVRSDRPMYRGQAAAVLLATLFPWGTNSIYLFGPVEFDTTPIGLIVTASLFTLAIVRYQLIDITPIARNKVIQNVRDGMFVVDTADNILDTNPAVREIMGVGDASLVGENAVELFGGLPNIRRVYEEMTADDSPSERQVTYRDRHLNIQGTPIRDDRDRHVGWLFLVHNVTELVQRERDLEQQIEKLDQFASIVSHDLRNPLNVARGYVQQTQATGDIEHLDKTEEAMERMEAIIEDALALAREGQDVTEPENVSLEAIARDAWEHVDTGSATVDIDADETVIADSDRLQRLFENSFRNSIEHGVPDDEDSDTTDHTVAVGLTDQTAETATIYIADDGVGIPDEKLDDVFESGYTTNEDGTGLGLSIVQQIASAHGWTVAVDHSESGGARFEIGEVPVAG